MRFTSLFLLLAVGTAACGGGSASSVEPECASDEACARSAAAPCQRAVCGVDGLCGVDLAPNGEGCGEGGLCYAGDCRRPCEASADCAEEAAGGLCVATLLGPDLESGLCFTPEAVTCAADEDCQHVLAGVCRGRACVAGLCTIVDEADGRPCELGACLEGSCRVPCAPGTQAACPIGAQCVASAAGAVCVPLAELSCDAEADCASLVTPTCHEARCDEGGCAVAVAADGSPCGGSQVCWQGACVGSGGCGPEGTCAPGRLCVSLDERAVCVPEGQLACDVLEDCQIITAPSCAELTCDPVAGRCALTPRADGTGCGEHRVCTQGTCRAACADSAICEEGELCLDLTDRAGGVCQPITCTTPEDCDGILAGLDPCEAVTCNSLTNRCQIAKVPDNTSCDDGDLCNGVWRCVLGTCFEVIEPASCPQVPGAPCTAFVCDPVSGACQPQPTLEGEACEDGNPCTSASTCADGLCTGGETTCEDCALDQECELLDDGDRCNGTWRCIEGICTYDPATVVSCAPVDEECLSAACAPDTGLCAPAPSDEGLPCKVSSDLCDARYQCEAGTCALLEEPVGCASPGPCLEAACDPNTGTCAATALPAAQTLYEGDFDSEADFGGWYELPPADDGSTWQVDGQRTWEGAWALYFGDADLRALSAGDGPVSGALETAPLTFSEEGGGAVLRFALWTDLDPRPAGDRVAVEAQVMPSGDADGTIVPLFELGPARLANQGRWLEHVVPLHELAGATARLRFVVDSLDGVANSGEGVYLDAVRVTEVARCCADDGDCGGLPRGWCEAARCDALSACVAEAEPPLDGACYLADEGRCAAPFELDEGGCEACLPWIDPAAWQGALYEQGFEWAPEDGWSVAVNTAGDLLGAAPVEAPGPSGERSLHLGEPDGDGYASDGQAFDLVLVSDAVPITDDAPLTLALDWKADVVPAAGDRVQVSVRWLGREDEQVLALIDGTSGDDLTAWRQESFEITPLPGEALVLRVHFHGVGAPEAEGHAGVLIDHIRLTRACDDDVEEPVGGDGTGNGSAGQDTPKTDP
jgi:hypothetical protein